MLALKCDAQNQHLRRLRSLLAPVTRWCYENGYHKGNAEPQLQETFRIISSHIVEACVVVRSDRPLINRYLVYHSVLPGEERSLIRGRFQENGFISPIFAPPNEQPSNAFTFTGCR